MANQAEKLILMVKCIDDAFGRATRSINRAVDVYKNDVKLFEDEATNPIGAAAFFKIQYLDSIYSAFGVYPYTKFIECIPEDIQNTLPKLLDSIEQFNLAIDNAAPYLEKAERVIDEFQDVELCTDRGVILAKMAIATLESFIAWQSLVESRENTINKHLRHLSMGKAIDDAEYMKTVSDIHVSNESRGKFHLSYTETMSLFIKAIAAISDTDIYDSFVSNVIIHLCSAHCSYASVTYRNINTDLAVEIYDGIDEETIKALQEANKI